MGHGGKGEDGGDRGSLDKKRNENTSFQNNYTNGLHGLYKKVLCPNMKYYKMMT